MNDKLLETIKELKSRGVDLKETPVIFRWHLPEYPEVLIEMMLSEPSEDEFELEGEEIVTEKEETVH